MLTKKQSPQWVQTLLLILLVPVIGYLVVSNIEQTRHEAQNGAQTEGEAQMLAYMHQQYESQHRRSGFGWTFGRHNGEARLMCYCDKRGYGWWYSVQPAANGQFTVTLVADTSAAAGSPAPGRPLR